jgi:hypothetical protein
MSGPIGRIAFNIQKKNLKSVKKAFEKISNEDVEELKNVLENVMGSVNNYTPSPTVPSSEGNVGDIKVVKTAKNKYDLFIKGEDSWHKDTNSSFNPVDKSPENQQLAAMQNNDGTIDYSFNDITRLTIDLDAGTVTGVATPILKASGNLKLQPTGTTTVDSTLSVSTISAADSDTDKFLVSDGGTVKYRTGSQLLSDIGAGSGDITGVTITTDSGVGSRASDTAGSADFSLLGSNGVGVTNSGATITAVAVPGEIDHDSLNNFVANEHIDWTGASAGTIHATNYTNTTYSEATGSAEGLMSIAHHDKLDGIEANATADQTQADINGLAITATGALNSGSITSGFGNIDNGASTLATGEITSGAVVWSSYPFNGNAMTNARGYYFRDSDDYDDFRRWDDFDADMALNYRKIWGHYVVPEDCTLKRMQGIVVNSGDTEDITVNVWYCLKGNISIDTSNTTFSKAGSDTDVTIGTSLVGVQFDEDYDVDLTAGSIIIPTLKTAGSTSQTYYGNLTLKYITR